MNKQIDKNHCDDSTTTDNNQSSQTFVEIDSIIIIFIKITFISNSEGSRKGSIF
jgi:hypothetical protein